MTCLLFIGIMGKTWSREGLDSIGCFFVQSLRCALCVVCCVLWLWTLTQLVWKKSIGASQALVGDIETQTFGVDASGASHAHVQKLVVNKLELDASGASKISIEKIQAQELKVSSSGASKVEVSGSSNTDKLDADISGASKYLGRNLVAKQAKVNASGASRADFMLPTRWRPT